MEKCSTLISLNSRIAYIRFVRQMGRMMWCSTLKITAVMMTAARLALGM